MTYMTCDHLSVYVDGAVQHQWTRRRDDLVHHISEPSQDESRYYEISIDTRSGAVNALRLASVAERKADPGLAQSDLRQLVAGTQIPCPRCGQLLVGEELSELGGPGTDEIGLVHTRCVENK